MFYTRSGLWSVWHIYMYTVIETALKVPEGLQYWAKAERYQRTKKIILGRDQV